MKRLLAFVLAACTLLAVAGVANADLTNQTLVVTPSTVQSANGKATFTVSGKNWTDRSGLPCKGGKLHVGLSVYIANGPFYKVLPKAYLPKGKTSFKKKVTISIRPGQYSVQASLVCVPPGGGQDVEGPFNTPLTVT
jgi:hypothetical protein